MHARNLASRSSRGCSDGFKSIDFFGERVEFTFKKKPYFQTNLGAVLSLICGIIILIFIFARTVKLMNDRAPFFSSTELVHTEGIDLWERGFMFAVEDIPPEVGTLSAHLASWDKDDADAVKTPIELVDCKELLPGGTHEG